MSTAIAEPEVVKPRELVNKAYPEKGALLRLAHYLFTARGDDFYRVDYHDPDLGNRVVESHFVQVHERNVIERTTRS